MAGGVGCVLVAGGATLLSLFGDIRRPVRLIALATACLMTVGAGVAGAYAAGGMVAGASHEDQTGKLIPLPRIGMQVAAMQHEAAVRAGQLSPLDRFLRPVVLAAAPLRVADPDSIAQGVQCLTAAVYYEARGESRDGQAAVAQVVLNRLRDPHFPKTVCAVVYQGEASHECQFTFACDGSTARAREPRAWERAKQVAGAAMAGYVAPAVGGATHYHVASLGDIWGSQLVRVVQIGQHIFYQRGHHAIRAPAPLELRGALKPAADPIGAVLASR
jgi:hypothetical protein